MNDGMYWTIKKYANKVAGTELHLNVLIRNMDEIHRLYNLCAVEIPIYNHQMGGILCRNTINNTSM